MELVFTEINDIKVINVNGSLDSTTASQANSEIAKLLEQGVKKIIIDLSKADFVSSAGLRTFLIVAKKISSVNGKFKLCSPNKVVWDTLEISGFTTILDVLPTFDQALAKM